MFQSIMGVNDNEEVDGFWWIGNWVRSGGAVGVGARKGILYEL